MNQFTKECSIGMDKG